jgi:carbonic anhydrase
MARSLDHLLDQNITWAQRRTRADPNFFVRMAEQQTPKYLWIGCSDSRVTAITCWVSIQARFSSTVMSPTSRKRAT